MNKKEQAYIAAHYATQKTKDIALYLGRTQDYVRQVARRMGLFRREAYQEGRKQCQGCVMYCNRVCLAHLDKCTAARFTKASWPKLNQFNHFD